MRGMDYVMGVLDEINDILPPPEEIVTEIRLRRSRWEGLREHFAKELNLSSPVGGYPWDHYAFSGIPVVFDPALLEDEIRATYADGHEEVIWPRT